MVHLSNFRLSQVENHILTSDIMIGSAIDAPLTIEALWYVDAENGIIRSLELHHHFLLLLLQILQELIMDLLQSAFLISCGHASNLLLSCSSFVTFLGRSRFYHSLN